MNSQTKDLIKRLVRYNKWRRGADIEQPHPAQIGKDIDAAIATIKQLEKESAEWKAKARKAYINGSNAYHNAMKYAEREMKEKGTNDG